MFSFASVSQVELKTGQTSEKRLAESLTDSGIKGLGSASEHLLLLECEVPFASILVTVGAFMAQAGHDGKGMMTTVSE